MESDFESVVSVSEPLEEEFVANIKSGPIDEESQVTIDEDIVSFNFNIAVALVKENGEAVDTEFTEAVGEKNFHVRAETRYVSRNAD